MKKCVLTIFMVCLFITSALAAGNEKKIALVMKALSNPFFIKMEEGARKYAEKNNIPFEVFGVERETEIKRQIGIVENLIVRKYGAIVIAPTDSKKLISVCKKAIDRGIVIINIDNPFHEPTMKQMNIDIPFVGSDNYQGATLVGNYLKKKLGNKGRVFVVEGIRGVENAELRKKGFIDSVTKNSSIEVVASESANWHTDEALSLTTKLIQKHAQIDAIFCANDSMAIGAIQSLDMFGLTGDILIGGYDNIEEARSEMRNKRMHATVEQHPELMGEYGVMLAAQGMQHKKIPQLSKTPLDLITYDCFDKKISLSMPDSTSFFKAMRDGASEAADLFGLQFNTIIANNDDARQLIDIQGFIENKSDIIIVTPTHAESVDDLVEDADDMVESADDSVQKTDDLDQSSGESDAQIEMSDTEELIDDSEVTQIDDDDDDDDEIIELTTPVQAPSLAPSVSEESIKETVREVLEEMVGERLDQLLSDIVESVVSQKIEDLQKELMA